MKIDDFFQRIIDLPPERQQAFHRWATALGQKEPEAQRIAAEFEGGLTPEETWAEVVRVYGGNQS